MASVPGRTSEPPWTQVQARSNAEGSALMNSMTDFIHLFVGGTTGKWRVEHASALTGPALTPVPRLAILDGSQTTTPQDGVWFLRGVTSYERSVHRAERSALVARQP